MTVITEFMQCSATTSISVHELSVFLSGQEFATPYHPLFMTAHVRIVMGALQMYIDDDDDESAAFRRNLKTRCFQSAITTP